MRRKPSLRPSKLSEWPEPFDARSELDWGRAEYSRRLLREHLDQSHDGASRRTRLIDQHVRRLCSLLPNPPARILDAACGPGLYAVRLAAAGYDVTGIDISPAAIRHARKLARSSTHRDAIRIQQQHLLELEPSRHPYDAAIVIYYVLEAFAAREQPQVLRRIAATMRARGRLIVEMRLRPDAPPGRTGWWNVVEQSVLSDRRHLLLGDTTFDPGRHSYVLREIAVFDDGTVATQQTSAWLCPFDRIPSLFERGGFVVTSMYEGWTAQKATPLSESIVVAARRST